MHAGSRSSNLVTVALVGLTASLVGFILAAALTASLLRSQPGSGAITTTPRSVIDTYSVALPSNDDGDPALVGLAGAVSRAYPGRSPR